MKRIIFVLAVAIMCAMVSGCSTKSAYTNNPEAEQVDPMAQFSVGNVSDSSGFKFDPDDEDAFNLV